MLCIENIHIDKKALEVSNSTTYFEVCKYIIATWYLLYIRTIYTYTYKHSINQLKIS